MENLLGLLRIHVKKGVNLAIRDISSSDPYVVVQSGKQVLTIRFRPLNLQVFFSIRFLKKNIASLCSDLFSEDSIVSFFRFDSGLLIV